MALWSRFFGSAGSQAVGVGMGTAAVPMLIPYAQDLENIAWENHAHKPLIAGVLAVGVAEGKIDKDWAAGEAAKTGISGGRFDVLIKAAKNGPGISAAYDMWRREKIDEAGFRNALEREGISEEWRTAFVQLKDEHLTPSQIALGIVRSLLKDPGFLPVKLDTSGGKVPSYGVSPIDPVKEAAGSGIDKERLRVMVGEIGQPMSLQSAASAVFRNIIAESDFNRAVAEGDVRPEWAEFILKQARQIPTARDFLENALRGYRTLDEALKGSDLHGMSRDDATMIYQNQGRSMAVRQITQALSRGGKFLPEKDEITDPYRASIVEGNLKPAYYNLAEHLQYTLPSPFVMRQLTASGVWSEAKAAKRLKDSGWIPQDADEAAHAWATGTGSTADPHVSKAQTQLWGTLHSAYLAGDADEATVREKLGQLGVAAGPQQTILNLWNHERELIRQRLTPAQVKKAMAKAVPNPATGAPWSYDDALTELLSRGWSSQDANTFLHE